MPDDAGVSLRNAQRDNSASLGVYGIKSHSKAQLDARSISRHAKTGFLSIVGGTLDAENPVSCNLQCV